MHWHLDSKKTSLDKFHWNRDRSLLQQRKGDCMYSTENYFMYKMRNMQVTCKLLLFLYFLSNPACNNRGERDCWREPNWRCSLVCCIRQGKCSDLLSSLIRCDPHLKSVKSIHNNTHESWKSSSAKRKKKNRSSQKGHNFQRLETKLQVQFWLIFYLCWFTICCSDVYFYTSMIQFA